jgi:hypothetical protein
MSINDWNYDRRVRGTLFMFYVHLHASIMVCSVAISELPENCMASQAKETLDNLFDS